MSKKVKCPACKKNMIYPEDGACNPCLENTPETNDDLHSASFDSWQYRETAERPKQKRERKRKYQLSGTVSIRNMVSSDPMEIEKEHTEIVSAYDIEDAIDVSLSQFTEEEEAVWNKGFKIEKFTRKKRG